MADPASLPPALQELWERACSVEREEPFPTALRMLLATGVSGDAVAEQLPDWTARVERAYDSEREDLSRALHRAAAAGADSLEAVLKYLPELTASEVGCFLQALSHLGRRRAVPLLVRSVYLHPDLAHWHALHQLGRLGGKLALQALVRFAREHLDEAIRTGAVYQLQFIKPSQEELLLSILEDPNQPVSTRSQAAEGLHLVWDARTRLYKRTVQALLEGLRDPSPELRFWCAYSLGQMQAKAAIPELERVAQEDPDVLPGWWAVRDEAADALTHIRGGPWPERERMAEVEAVTTETAADPRIS